METQKLLAHLSNRAIPLLNRINDLMQYRGRLGSRFEAVAELLLSESEDADDEQTRQAARRLERALGSKAAHTP